jgi:hypothetical protein
MKISGPGVPPDFAKFLGLAVLYSHNMKGCGLERAAFCQKAQFQPLLLYLQENTGNSAGEESYLGHFSH